MRLVIAERTGFVLPSLATGYGSEANIVGVTGEVEAAREGGDWLRVEPGREHTFDVVEMALPARLDGQWVFAPLHVGVVAAAGWLLHVERATASLLARYDEDAGVRRRVLGFWRHHRLA